MNVNPRPHPRAPLTGDRHARRLCDAAHAPARRRGPLLIRFSIGCCCGLTAIAAVALAQTAPGADAFRLADQVAQLDAQRAALADALAAPPALVEISRLLSEPADQLTWLLARIEEIRAGDAAAAQQLSDLARQRLKLLREQGASGLEPFEGRLGPVAQAARRKLAELIDAAELSERVRANDPADFANLSDAERFALSARGVAPERLGLPREASVRGLEKAAGADAVRQAVLVLAATESRAGAFGDLLNLDAALRGAAASVQSAGGTVRGAAGAYRVAAALIGRALGADGQDRGAPADDDAASWSQLAAELQTQELWLWASLARVLQSAAAADSGGDSRQPLADAQAMLDHAARVSGASSAAGPAALQKTMREWIAALGSGGAGGGGAGLRPFGNTSRSRERQQRQEFEQRFLAARSGGNADDAFRQMQLAKAAEAGAPTDGGGTLSIAEVETKLTKPVRGAQVPRLHFFLEMLAVNEGGRAAYYGVVIYSTKCDNTAADTIAHELIGPSGSAADLVDQSVRLACTGKAFADGKILIAPDGEARGAAWAAGKHRAVLAANLAKADTRPWLVYVPTASFLKSGEPRRWGADRVLAIWHRAALAAGGEAFRVQTRVPPEQAAAFRAFDFKVDGAGLKALDFGGSAGAIGLLVPTAGR